MQFVSREEWGSRTPANAGRSIGQVDLVVIHHSWRPHVEPTAGKDAEINAMRGMENFHMDNRGWQGIGYNFCVFQSGRVYEGRGFGRSGAHTKGKNSSSIGICFVIDGNNHPPTDEAWRAAWELLQFAVDGKNLTPGYRVDGHRDFQAKDCPGHKVYPLLEEKLEGKPKEESVAFTERDREKLDYIYELFTRDGEDPSQDADLRRWFIPSFREILYKVRGR